MAPNSEAPGRFEDDDDDDDSRGSERHAGRRGKGVVKDSVYWKTFGNKWHVLCN